MPERILHQTWTIRTISPFAIPLFSSPHCFSLESLEEELTRCVRRYSKDEESAWSEGGTYVTLTWMEIQENSTAAGNKRQRSRRHLHVDIRVQDQPAGQVVFCFARERHDVFVSSFSFVLSRGQATACGAVFEWMESSLGCIVGVHPFLPSPTDVACALTTWTTLDGFSPKPLQLTFGVPTSELDKVTFSIPSVALTKLCREMERLQSEKNNSEGVEKESVLSVMDEAEADKQAPGTDDSETDKEASSVDSEMETDAVVTDIDHATADKEAIGTYSGAEQAQNELQRNKVHLKDAPSQRKRAKLDTMQNIDEARCAENRYSIKSPDESLNSQKEEALKSNFATADADASVVTDSSNDDCHAPSLPVLWALRRFAWEAFHINIQSFPMIRASSAVAVLGCDGRCRFTDASHLSCVLQEIETMIGNRIRTGGIGQENSTLEH